MFLSDRGHFPLLSPEDLPLQDLASVVQQRVVVVAPHPDDETLGCGGAIAILCNQGCDVKVLVISDGTLSHPNSQKYPAPALQSMREQETLTALALLGVKQEAITFLRLKDGSVPSCTAPHFKEAKVRCQDYLQKAIPETIFMPRRFDPHPDHRATWQLIRTALLELGMMPRRIEYPIWDWDAKQQKKISDFNRIAGWRLDIDAVLERKRQAIAAYRSQLGQIIDDDPHGFCLLPELLANFVRPWEVYFEEVL